MPSSERIYKSSFFRRNAKKKQKEQKGKNPGIFAFFALFAILLPPRFSL